MKILFLSHHLKGNDGWSRYSRDLIRAVRKEGAEVLCLVNELSPETDIPQKQCLGEPLKYVVNPLLSFRTALEINKVIKEFKPDIIQFPVEPYGTTIPFLKKGAVKIVLNAHSTFAYLPILVAGVKRNISEWMTRWTYAKTDSVICISHYTKKHLLHHMASIGAVHLVEHKIDIVWGGIDLRAVQADATRPFSEPGEILFVGALKPRKGLLEAVTALGYVKTDFVFRIVGMFDESNKYVHLVKEKIAELNLQNKVVFMGQISDEELFALYQKADLFLMLSTNNGADFEGYGLVYLEAHARGVPCIGPTDSGVSDAIVHEKTGYLVDQFNPQLVAEAVDRVLRDHTIKRSDCVEWARHNTIEHRASQMMGIYRKIMVI